MTGNEICTQPTTDTVAGYLSEGSVIAGGGRTDLAADQHTTTTPATVLVPVGTRLTADSTVTDVASGRVYEVFGEPADRGAPGSSIRFRAAALRRVSDLHGEGG